MVNFSSMRGGSFKIFLLRFMCINVASYTISLFIGHLCTLQCVFLKHFWVFQENEPRVFNKFIKYKFEKKSS